VIDVPDAWGMLLSRSWSTTLGGFLSMDLTHAHIPMGDGTFQILYNREKVDRHVMDPDGPDYANECDYDVLPQTIEYDPSELPFMQEDSIDTCFFHGQINTKTNLQNTMGRNQGLSKF
jgi:hypothetical protein